MCLSPIRRKNPNYGLKETGIMKYMADTESAYINLPCGHCSECIAARQSAWVQRVQMESLNNYLFMLTLTYDNEHLPKISSSAGDTFAYANYEHIKLMMKRVRKREYIDRPFKYIIVSELGSKHGRPHFHGIISVPKHKGDNPFTPLNIERTLRDAFRTNWSINVGTRKHPRYESLFTYKKKIVRGKTVSNYDFHYITSDADKLESGSTAVAYYVSKYIMKDSVNENKRKQRLFATCEDPEEAHRIWSIIRSKTYKSLEYGLDNEESTKVATYIRGCVERSLSDNASFAGFYNPDNGRRTTLCKYYRSKPTLYTLEDHVSFWRNRTNNGENCVNFTPEQHSGRARRCLARTAFMSRYEDEKHDLLLDSGLLDGQEDDFYNGALRHDVNNNLLATDDFDNFDFEETGTLMETIIGRMRQKEIDDEQDFLTEYVLNSWARC